MTPGARIKDAICQSVIISPLPESDIEQVTTPFLDSDGAPVHVFTSANHVTDGGAVLNNLRSMRAIEDYEKWPFRQTYLHRYGILERENGELESAAPNSKDSLLRYLQGIARLPGFFEMKPVGEASRFPALVSEQIDDYLKPRTPPGRRPGPFIKAIKARKSWKFSGVPFETDYTPLRRNLMVQVLSYPNSDAGVQRQHVHYKLMPFEFGKKRQKSLELALVVPRLTAYPLDLRRLMKEETQHVFQWDRENDREEFASLLVKLPSSNRI